MHARNFSGSDIVTDFETEYRHLTLGSHFRFVKTSSPNVISRADGTEIIIDEKSIFLKSAPHPIDAKTLAQQGIFSIITPVCPSDYGKNSLPPPPPETQVLIVLPNELL